MEKRMTKDVSYVFVPEVYVIESATIEDYTQELQEGKALCECLNIMGIPNFYFPVFTKSGFEYVLKQVAPSHCVKKDEENNIEEFTVPIIHISAHGARDCFALTNNSTISWKELKSFLAPVNAKCNECLILCMSVCKGFMAYKAAETLKSSEVPFFQLIGPKENISWKDSLLGFHIFYNRFDLLCNDKSDELKNIMNCSISKDIFEIIDGESVQTKYHEKIVRVVHNLLSSRIKR